MGYSKKNKKGKRKSQRLGLNLPVKFKKAKGGSTQTCFCSDIGGKGIKIHLRENLEINDKVKLSLCLQDESKPIDMLCRVAWCKKETGDEFCAGLEFLEIKEKRRFIGFLTEKLLELFSKDK